MRSFIPVALAALELTGVSLTAVALTTALAASLFGCGKKSDAPSSSASSEAPGKGAASGAETASAAGKASTPTQGAASAQTGASGAASGAASGTTIAVSAPASPCVALLAKRGTPAINGKLDQDVWREATRTEAFVAERGNGSVAHTEARASWDEKALYLQIYVADDNLRSTDRVTLEFDGGIEAAPQGKPNDTRRGDASPQGKLVGARRVEAPLQGKLEIEAAPQGKLVDARRIPAASPGRLVIEAAPQGKLDCTFQGAKDCKALGIRAGFDVDGDVDSDEKEDEEWGVTIALPWRSVAPSGRPTELAVTLRRSDSERGGAIRQRWGRSCTVVRLAHK
ncbi:MAG: sugar-binding protein [Polyangiaceae bacterium]